MAHRYQIGELVTCDVGLGQRPAKPMAFTVEAQMPPVGTSLQYRIKSVDKSFRRVVSEHQLSVVEAST